MRATIRSLSIISLIILFACAACAQQADPLADTLAAIPGVKTVEKLAASEEGISNWLIMFEQPIDHENPWRGSFTQRMFLTHRDSAAPMVMITDGYNVDLNIRYELTNYLGANQLYIEHRYFGQSAPEKLDWQYLTIEQAAEDHHAIRTAFGSVYGDKWISTGISKGGQTALYYKYFYPQDVTATVAYVAPIALAQEDGRIWEFLAEVGSEECREEIAGFQRRVLENREAMLAFLKEFEEKYKQEFLLGREATLEIIVAEYPFSFWQFYKGLCGKHPGQEATAKELYDHLRKSVPFFLYTKKSWTGLQPAFYQFVTQIGYYGFEVDHLGDLIKHREMIDNRHFGPPGVELKYDGTLVHKMHPWLETRAQNVIYIYGALDTWSACAISPASSTNSFAVYQADGNHGTRIGSLTPEDRKRILDALAGWTGIEIHQEEK